ncbi:MAG: HEPN domain-containing protein [Victivallaceae bacterium]|nr:HEPN domain-containing protein [Victivallaceae bacterium]
MMDLTGILSYLPDSKVKELEIITQRIVDAKRAEIVILYGSYARGNYREQRGKITGARSDYDILAISSNINTRNGLRSKLRDLFDDIEPPVQVIAEEIDFVNKNLEENQFFFTDIKHEGKVLYDSGKCELSNSKDMSPTRRREIAEKNFREWFKSANRFFENSEFNFQKNYYREASFMLQQVIEMCYKAIEMVFIHYNPYEHKLMILRERALEFDERIKEALPYETEEQKELFNQLDFAYIGARYLSEEEFSVSKEQLDYWSKEAKKMLELTEIICKEKIDNLKNIEQKLKTEKISGI